MGAGLGNVGVMGGEGTSCSAGFIVRSGWTPGRTMGSGTPSEVGAPTRRSNGATGVGILGCSVEGAGALGSAGKSERP